MRDQEILGLYEAYKAVYSNVNEEVEQLDEVDFGAAYNKAETAVRTSQNPAARVLRAALQANPKGEKARREKRLPEETDLFDTILEYLVAEGYADTNEAAITIMANMSEEWRQSIVEYKAPDIKGDGKGKPQERDTPGHSGPPALHDPIETVPTPPAVSKAKSNKTKVA